MLNKEIIDKANRGEVPSREELIQLLSSFTDEDREYAAKLARAKSQETFGNAVYTRGLIEFSNYCKNNCLYCGIRAGNKEVQRYRLSKEEILDCCEQGYNMGYRTFVMQGGEDPFFTDELFVDIISTVRSLYPDCAITLSLGERSRESYQKLFDAGANRYLLRHESISPCHYAKLHPESMSWQRRMQCLRDLKEIGFQTGCGCMIGSPYQSLENLADELLFYKEFNPQMVGMGPFLPHHATPFKDEKPGSVEMSLMMLSMTRLLLPKVLLPSTTALGTAEQGGRNRGILAGANVIMPNLSPLKQRSKYLLYDNKTGLGEDASEQLVLIEELLNSIGYRSVVARGDYPGVN